MSPCSRTLSKHGQIRFYLLSSQSYVLSQHDVFEFILKRDDCPAEVRSIRPSSFIRPIVVCTNQFLDVLVSLIRTGQEQAATSIGSYLSQLSQRYS